MGCMVGEGVLILMAMEICHQEERTGNKEQANSVPGCV